MAKAVTKISEERKQQIERLKEYGKAASAQSTIVGKLLRFTKGEFVAGQDDDEIAEGTRVIVNLDSLMAGWTRWQDNKPAEQDMGAIMDGFQPKKRSELGFTDEGSWPVDDEGVARDPWQFGNQGLMKGEDDGELYTFTTTSQGGIAAIGKMCTKAVEYMQEGHGDEYPVVELNNDFYKHAKYGKVYIPVFEIVDWVSRDTFEEEEKAKPKAVAAKGKAAAPKKPAGKVAGGKALTYR